MKKKQFKQHWLVWLLFSKPDIIDIRENQIHYEKRRFLRFLDKNYVHARANTVMTSEFQMSRLFTWIILVPVWFVGLIFGISVPLSYGKITIKSETATNQIKYVVNHKQLVKQLIN